MSTSVNLRKLLHRKQWEMCSPCPVSTAAGAVFRHLEVPTHNIKFAAGLTAVNQQWHYDTQEDAWLLLPGSASAGTFGAGAGGFISPIGKSGTATAGTTTTITTSLTINQSLAGYKVRITGGPAAPGSELTIVSNTFGANSVLTVAAQANAFTTATTFALLTPTLYYFCPGAGAVGFNAYDWATNTWTVLAVANLPTTWVTDGKLVGTSGIKGGSYESHAGKTFSACTTTVLTLSAGSNWSTNQWANMQLRVTGGTGAGQIRSIASNTALTLTLTAALTTALDSSSTYVIEGNDDYIYLFGNAAVTAYRYSRTANTWTVLAPATARGAAPGAGMSADWISSCSGSDWTDPAAIKNGRYIYSFRGAGGTALDLYDIAGNTWINGRSYGNQGESFTTGTVYEYDVDSIYVLVNGGSRVHRLDLIDMRLEPLSNMGYPQGAACVGDKLFIGTYTDGGTTIKFLYALRQTGPELLRLMLY